MLDRRGFNILMVINAALNLGATLLLTVKPEIIANSVGFPAVREAHPMGYMLGASEVGLVIMFFFGRNVQDTAALRVILEAGAGFHIASALAQIYAIVQDQEGNAVWVNILLRTVLASLLLYSFNRLPSLQPNPRTGLRR